MSNYLYIFFTTHGSKSRIFFCATTFRMTWIISFEKLFFSVIDSFFCYSFTKHYMRMRLFYIFIQRSWFIVNCKSIRLVSNNLFNIFLDNFFIFFIRQFVRKCNFQFKICNTIYSFIGACCLPKFLRTICPGR